MTIFDFILILIIFGFIYFGFWFGLVHTLGALFGVIVGTFIASHVFEPFSDIFSFFFGGNLNITRVVIFVIIFVFFNRLVGFLFYGLEKTFDIMARLPYLRSINRLGGMVFGFIEGSLVLGMILFVSSRYPWSEFVEMSLLESALSPVFIGVAHVLVPLVPEVLRKLQGII